MDAGFTNAEQLRKQLDHAMPIAHHAKMGSVLRDLINNANAAVTDVTAALNTRMMSKAGLAIKAADSAVVKAVNAFVACASGTLVRKAANTDMAALTGTLATAKSAAWAFYIRGDGTLSASAKTTDKTTHDLALAAVTAAPAGLVMIGIVVIDNATGSNFVGGTTALDVVSLTVTYYDVTGPSTFAPTAVAVGALGTR